MKLYLTEKFYRDTHNSNYYTQWEKELTDIWKPTYDYEGHSSFAFSQRGRCCVWFYFKDDKTFQIKLSCKAKPNSMGKRSVYLEEFVEPIEDNLSTLIKLVQHGYARLEE